MGEKPNPPYTISKLTGYITQEAQERKARYPANLKNILQIIVKRTQPDISHLNSGKNHKASVLQSQQATEVLEALLDINNNDKKNHIWTNDKFGEAIKHCIFKFKEE